MNNINEIVLFQPNESISLEVMLDDDTVWLTQQQIAELFNTARTSIVEHIKHIYEDEELEKNATCRKFRQVRIEGNREVSKTQS